GEFVRRRRSSACGLHGYNLSLIWLRSVDERCHACQCFQCAARLSQKGERKWISRWVGKMVIGCDGTQRCKRERRKIQSNNLLSTLEFEQIRKRHRHRPMNLKAVAIEEAKG